MTFFADHNYTFTDTEQPDEDELTIDYYDDLYCPACDKSFKSDKAWVTLTFDNRGKYNSVVSNSVILQDKLQFYPLSVGLRVKISHKHMTVASSNNSHNSLSGIHTHTHTHTRLKISFSDKFSLLVKWIIGKYKDDYIHFSSVYLYSTFYNI